MASPRKRSPVVAAWFAAATILSFPAQAQEQALGEIDSAVVQSQDPASGVRLARALAAEGDLIAAAATLERVLIVHPGAAEARLLYAGLLCRLDDRLGARVELSLLRAEDVTDPAWAELTGLCGPLPRPEPAR